MKKLTQLLILFSLVILSDGCKKTAKVVCESGTFYYTPKCATLRGMLQLDNSSEMKLVVVDVDPKFKIETGIRVCVTYTTKENFFLTADCNTGGPGSVITITSMEAL